MLLPLNRVMMIASEAAPFAKSGGLADVTGSLSRALLEAEREVRIIMPLYDTIETRGLVHQYEISIKPGIFPEEKCIVHTGQLPDSAVQVYFLDHPWYRRKGIYGNPEQPFFHDNFRRFALLCYAAFAVMEREAWFPRIIHAHDWPTALALPLLAKRRSRPEWRDTRTVFTIHNIGYQGIFPLQDIHYTDLDRDDFADPLVSDENINLMATGIRYADAITTVSPSHAREICRKETGFGLDRLLRNKRNRLTGILNGVDYSIWDPTIDPFLPIHYSAETLVQKRKARTALLNRIQMESNSRTPVIGMVSRLTEQKGFYEILDGNPGFLERLAAAGQCRIIILGTGDEVLAHQLERLDRKYPALRFVGRFDEELAHLIEAGSDFFFMPSRYEPCGLNQIYSMRYGTIPIVRATGGLKDTVTPVRGGKGSGYVFESFDVETLEKLFERIITSFSRSPEHFDDIRRRIMQASFDWERSAAGYLKVYESCF